MKKRVLMIILIFTIICLFIFIRPMIVMSGSMQPNIKTGSLCLVNSKAFFDKIEEGDVITYEVMDTKITHRVHSIVKDGFVTKGDDNDVVDLGIVTKDNFYGKVIFDIPYLGYVFFYAKKYIYIILIICVISILLGTKKKER